MASVEKYTREEVLWELKHNYRLFPNPTNSDIAPELSHLNKTLQVRDGEIPSDPAIAAKNEYEYFKVRLNELRCMNRADVKVLAGWVVTLPKEITGEMEQERFFQGVLDFLSLLYGKKNIISARVHYDEGVRDKSGKLIVGQPHIHVLFIPVSVDKKRGEEKVCAKEVLSKKALKVFHSDLQSYLNKNGISGKVVSGITKKQGGNISVAGLKRITEIEKQVSTMSDRLAKLEAMVEHGQQEKSSGSRWSNNSNSVNNRRW